MRETTVAKMRIGSRLIMGEYGAVGSENREPISWLKAERNGSFITEFVIDYLPFDALEIGEDRLQRQNKDFLLSNIFQYLNSMGYDWYKKSHDYDSPPAPAYLAYGQRAYERNEGFLSSFEDYELSQMVSQGIIFGDGEAHELIRLPYTHDIETDVGGRCFTLFNKKGRRGRLSTNLIRQPRMPSSGFASFYVITPDGICMSYSTCCSFDYGCADYNDGIRPVCMLRQDTVVEEYADGLYRIKPTAKQENLFSDKEFFDLLGMVQP